MNGAQEAEVKKVARELDGAAEVAADKLHDYGGRLSSMASGQQPPSESDVRASAKERREAASALGRLATLQRKHGLDDLANYTGDIAESLAGTGETTPAELTHWGGQILARHEKPLMSVRRAEPSRAEPSRHKSPAAAARSAASATKAEHVKTAQAAVDANKKATEEKRGEVQRHKAALQKAAGELKALEKAVPGLKKTLATAKKLKTR